MTIQLALTDNLDNLQRILEVVQLDSLPTTDELMVGRNMTDKIQKEEIESLAQSIQDHGLAQPITISEHSDGTRHLKDGRKRVLALRLLGKTEVLAQIVLKSENFPEEDWVLIYNNFRTKNSVMEIQALLSLVAKGATMEELKRKTGMKKDEIERLLQMRNLEPKLRTAVETGRMTLNVAHEALKISPAVRQPLVEAATKGKKITQTMVTSARNVTTQQARAAQPMPSLPMPAIRSDYVILFGNGQHQFEVNVTREEAVSKAQAVSGKLYKLLEINF